MVKTWREAYPSAIDLIDVAADTTSRDSGEMVLWLLDSTGTLRAVKNPLSPESSPEIVRAPTPFRRIAAGPGNSICGIAKDGMSVSWKEGDGKWQSARPQFPPGRLVTELTLAEDGLLVVATDNAVYSVDRSSKLFNASGAWLPIVQISAGLHGIWGVSNANGGIWRNRATADGKKSWDQAGIRGDVARVIVGQSYTSVWIIDNGGSLWTSDDEGQTFGQLPGWGIVTLAHGDNETLIWAITKLGKLWHWEEAPVPTVPDDGPKQSSGPTSGGPPGDDRDPPQIDLKWNPGTPCEADGFLTGMNFSKNATVWLRVLDCNALPNAFPRYYEFKSDNYGNIPRQPFAFEARDFKRESKKGLPNYTALIAATDGRTTAKQGEYLGKYGPYLYTDEVRWDMADVSTPAHI